MFRVVNADGQQLAQYPTANEMREWIKISVDHQNHQTANVQDNNNFEVHDQGGKMLFRFSGPKPGDDSKPGETILS